MHFKSAYFSVLVTLSTFASVHAWFRVACTDPLVQERIDPIISPGITPSQHTHTVHGGSISQDLSNYWFPKLYFHSPANGTFSAVPDGGLLVYYQNRGDGDPSNGGKGLTAFPAGFRMVSGSPARRSLHYPINQGSQGELAERAIQCACIGGGGPAGYDSTSTNGAGFPYTDCPGGFNARIHMPACWDGVNLDSPDHVSHTAFLSQLDNGDCPSTHPVYMMKLFYEITWDVHSFATSGLWNPATNPWPFVYATGDPTGYSWHGDFLNGWDTTALQNAITSCNSTPDQLAGKTEACPYLNVIPAETANLCKISPTVNEVVSGAALSALPGCNPIQAGPGNATLYTAANCPGH